MNIISGNASDALVITPNDTTAISPSPIAFYTAGAGTITVVTRKQYDLGIKAGLAIAAMNTVTITTVAGGTLNLQIAVVKTGGSASGIIGLYP
jgi:hypothetical protein